MNKKRRNELNRIKDAMKLYEITFSFARDIVRGNATYDVWKDKQTGKLMQKCSYERYGTCTYPCNGDC